MEDIKVGVYTICKNESKFVGKWLESMWREGRGADRAYVLDTGSTDGTVKLFKREAARLGIPKKWLEIKKKTYKHFRFDTARNDNLDMIPPHSFDVLVSVDLDEVLIPQFWDDLRKIVAEHPDFSRINYLYAWNHNEDGEPGRVFWYNKVHPQMGYRYKGAVHEWCDNVDPERYRYGGEYNLDADTIYLHHYPDNAKSRGSYMPLLEMRIKEDPNDISAYIYLVNEYFAHGMWGKAFAVANAGYLKDKDGDLSFLFAGRIADIYSRYGLEEEADRFYRMAIEKDKTIRNSYINYAQFLVYHGRPDEALGVLASMEISSYHHKNWMELDYDWTWRPLHIKAVAYCWAGRYVEAQGMFEQAEQNYIKTDKDRAEAESCGFYTDYQWLKNHLNGEAGNDEQGI